jgi:pilus assembly protein CpaC
MPRSVCPWLWMTSRFIATLLALQALFSATLYAQPSTVGDDNSHSKQIIELTETIHSNSVFPPIVNKETDRYIKNMIDPAFTIDVIVGRPRILVFDKAPRRLHAPDDGVAFFDMVTKTNLSIVGRQTGITLLNLWFSYDNTENNEEIISYLVRVFPDPSSKERNIFFYKTLETEINKAFPNSIINLSLVGNKLVVRGQAHDIEEANQIFRLLEEHAPTAYIAANVPVAREESSDIADLNKFELQNNHNIINLLRVPGAPQVMLRVTVAEVNRSAARSLGMDFSFVDNEGDFALDVSPGNILESGAQQILMDFTGEYQFLTAISALRSLNLARSLAEPNLVALNGKSASFKAGGEFPVPVVAGSGGGGNNLQGIEFVPFGVSLEFTPYITDGDRIRLHIAAEVSARQQSGSLSVGGGSVSGLESRNFTTTVELHDGEALAIAGLMQSTFGSNAARIPFLGDLPFIGWIFGLNGTSSSEQELIIIISPELVQPLPNKNAIPFLPGDDIFEPDDLEFYLFNRLESRNLEDYRSSARTDFTRMRKFRRGDQEYIQGPSGFSEP